MEFKDYYKIMGIEEKASPEDIKKAYKKLARKFHPDVSKETDAEKKFKEVGEAYEVLSDPAKRQEYDQLKAMGAAGGNGQFRPPPGWDSAHRQYSHGFEGDPGGGDFSDFFEAMFGRGGFQHSASRAEGAGSAGMRLRGEDVQYELALLLEEAYRGSEQMLELRIPEIDQRGRRVQRSKKLKVKIPAGSVDGSVLRMKGQGGPGAGGGEPGDLLLTIRLASHPLYTVDGKNISLVVPVAPWEAANGCKLTVPTLGGKTRVTIPPDSQTGQKLRLAGQGMPGKPPGDFFLVLKVVMPDKTTSKAKELYEALQQELAFNPRSAWEEI